MKDTFAEGRPVINLIKQKNKYSSFDKKEYKKFIKRMKNAPIMLHNIPTKREIVRKGIISRIRKFFKK